MPLRYSLLLPSLLLLHAAFGWNTPNQSSPSSGSTAWTGVTVNWAPVASSQAYQLQVDTGAAFNSPLLYAVTKAYINSTDGNSDTREALSGLRFGTTYRWRVRAYITGDTSAWSPSWTFTTRDEVYQSSPATGAFTWTGVTLNWGVHEGVTFYDAQVDTTPAFNSPAFLSVSNPYINNTDGNADTRWDVNNLYFGTTYHWRVRCRNAVDTSAWSPVWTFTTYDLVAQTSPADGAFTWTGLTLNWGVHAGVSHYEAQVDTTPAFNSPAFLTVSNPYINNTDGNADTRWDVNNLYFGTTYHWRVRCRNAVDTSAWSAVRTFTTYDLVGQTSPADGATTWVGPTLNWGVHAGVTHYDLQADTSLSFSTPALRSVSTVYINNTDGNADTRWDATGLYFGTTYHWRVRCRNAVDTSAWSPVWTFTTRDDVSLTSPADGALNLSVAGVTLNWAPHVGVVLYQSQWDTTNLFNTGALQSVDDPYINNTDGNTDTQNPTGALLADQWYFWRVRAINTVDTSAWTVRSFSTGSTPIVLPGTPTLLAPANASLLTVGNVDLLWSAVPGVAGYEYQLSTLADLSNVPPIPATGTQVNVAPLNAGTTYFWRVRSLLGGNASPWSAAWSFTYDPSTGAGATAAPVFTVYPNPTSGQLQVIAHVPAGGTWRIVDTLGRTVYTTAHTAMRGTLDVSALSPGTYVLMLEDGLLRLAQRFVKE